MSHVLKSGNGANEKGIDDCEGEPIRSVDVQVADEELRVRVAEILRTVGCVPQCEGEGAPWVVIRDREGNVAKGAPIIRLWDIARHKKTSETDSNPFEQENTVGWIGVAPEVDTLGVGSMLAHLRTRQFSTLDRLLEQGAQIITNRENQSKAKRDHLARLADFGLQAGASRHVLEGLELALDELFTNAVYDAPTGEDGRHLNASEPRSVPVTSPRPFAIRFGRDGRQIAVSVCDKYGTLKVDNIVKALRRCFAPGGARFEMKSGGAGLGFFMLLQNANHLVINAKAGQFTEVTFIRRLDQRRRDFMRSSPTLTLCMIDGQEALASSRVHPRRVVEWPATVSCCDGASLTATILDISLGGLFVGASNLKAARGDDCRVRFQPNGKEEVDLRCVVRWNGYSNEHNRLGVGLGFESELDNLAGMLGSGLGA